MRIYWETSAVNFVAKKYEYQDAIATKNLQTKKGNQFYISPITIWEILLIKNPEVKEKILFYAQHLFNENLLKSPSEILLDYIQQGCPRFQGFRSFNSVSILGKVWSAMCADKRNTITYDEQKLNAATAALKSLSILVGKIIINPTLKTHFTTKEEKINAFINVICQSVFSKSKENDINIIRTRRLSVLLTYFYLCLNIDITHDVGERFWNVLGLTEPLERLRYISDRYPSFFQSGPMWVIANVVYFQTIKYKKTNRGAIHDGLHAVYLPFIDRFITNDIQFKELKSVALRDFYKKIFHLSELRITESRVSLIHL